MSNFDVSRSAADGVRNTLASTKSKGADKSTKTGKKTAGSTPRSPQKPPPSADTELLFATFPQLANPQIDQKGLADVLKKLEVDLFQGQMLSENEIIKTNEDQVKNLSKQNQKRLADQLKKLEKQKTSDIISKVFSWLAAVLAVVVGVVLAVVSFGTGATAAGALITASLVVAVAVTIMNATGGMEKMVKALAVPVEEALKTLGVAPKMAKRIAEIAMQVIVTVSVIVIQIVLAVMSGGATAANFASELANKIAAASVKITNFALAISQLTAASSQISSSAFRYQAMEDMSLTERDKAILKKISTLIEAEQDTIKELINFILGVQKKMGALIKDENENRGKLADIDARSAAV